MENDTHIQIRISREEKAKLVKRAKKLNMSLSEFTRLLYEFGEIKVVPHQTVMDIRGMAININQIARKLNGGSVTFGQGYADFERLMSKFNVDNLISHADWKNL